MDVNTLKFTANLDGSIKCEIYDSLGEKQNLNGCFVKFCLGYEYEDDAIISLNMTILEDGSCIINLTPTDTEMLSVGEYWFNLLITDTSNKKHGTEKIKLSIDKPIE